MLHMVAGCDVITPRAQLRPKQQWKLLIQTWTEHKTLSAVLYFKQHFTSTCLQDDVVLADVVKNLSEQLQQVQLQLAEQQAINAEQARQIGALTKNVAKQDEHVNLLTDNFARLEAEHKVIAALQDTGVALVSVQNFKT